MHDLALCVACRYQPYDLGFQHSVLPTPYIFKDNAMYVNGNTKQTQGRQQLMAAGCVQINSSRRLPASCARVLLLLVAWAQLH